MSTVLLAARKLGYGEVKSEQSRVIREIVAGNDVFVALPTGYGKSLCYALLPLVFDFVRWLVRLCCAFLRWFLLWWTKRNSTAREG